MNILQESLSAYNNVLESAQRLVDIRAKYHKDGSDYWDRHPGNLGVQRVYYRDDSCVIEFLYLIKDYNDIVETAEFPVGLFELVLTGQEEKVIEHYKELQKPFDQERALEKAREEEERRTRVERQQAQTKKEELEQLYSLMKKYKDEI